MKQTRKNKISPYHQKRLEKIGLMLREMRFSMNLNSIGGFYIS